MFYSQFILAKKGPLGTIWIAAHLERKLRKNQVADTDIGVSVDSILCPDVPIALRLSSHLLLGVVRIYNRKVNYLFDDCSEALLKVKQAFRSTAVDLPPEESKAPYHSITLPEKFDLDDFELPDSDINLGNYVDHHISSREQITLQDTMEGVGYSASKFGLDERFGDGGASELDLDEELFLIKAGTAGHADESADPQASYRPSLKPDEHPLSRSNSAEIMAYGEDEPGDLTDYAQSPHTPRLVEEPNLSNAKDASACDDLLESEYHLMESAVRESGDSVPYEDKQEVNWCSRDDIISEEVAMGQHEKSCHLLSGVGINESNPQRVSPLEGQDEATRPISECIDGINAADGQLREDFPIDAVKEVSKTDNNHQRPSEVDMEINSSSDKQFTEFVTLRDLTSPAVDVFNCVRKASNQQESCDDSSCIAPENQVASFLEAPETRAYHITATSMNLEFRDKEVASVTLLSGACNSVVENPIVTKPGDCNSIDAGATCDVAVLATYEREETMEPGTKFCININHELSQKENQVREYDGSRLAPENQVASFLEATETLGYHSTTTSMNLVAHDKEVASVTILSGACNSVVENPLVTKPGDCNSTDADVKYDVAVLATYEREETMEPAGTKFCININRELSQMENQVREYDGSCLAPENQVASFLEATETRAYHRTTTSMNLEAHDKEVASVTILSGPCNSVVENPIVTKPGNCNSTDADVNYDVAVLATYEREETMERAGTQLCININRELSQKENKVREYASCEDDEANIQVHNAYLQDRSIGDLNKSTEPELPAPEKLLSVPEGHVDSHRDILVKCITGGFEGLDVGDTGSKTATGRKRSFTESTLTEQSLNSAESSRRVRSRSIAGSVPDDSDFLSAILVGRKSSALKVRPTPPLTEVTSMKRSRTIPRSSAPKRKVLMDDTMVLHGDTIRHQLTNTEDIRRVRKKAPCTLSEMSVIQKQHMDDDIFVESVFTGMAAELAYIYNQHCDLGHIRVYKDDANSPSLQTLTEPRLPPPHGTNLSTPQSTFGLNLASFDDKCDASLETVAGLHWAFTNNENQYKPLDEDVVIKPSEQRLKDPILIEKYDEIAAQNEIPPKSEIVLHGANNTRADVNFSREHCKVTEDVVKDPILIAKDDETGALSEIPTQSEIVLERANNTRTDVNFSRERSMVTEDVVKYPILIAKDNETAALSEIPPSEIVLDGANNTRAGVNFSRDRSKVTKDVVKDPILIAKADETAARSEIPSQSEIVLEGVNNPRTDVNFSREHYKVTEDVVKDPILIAKADETALLSEIPHAFLNEIPQQSEMVLDGANNTRTNANFTREHSEVTEDVVNDPIFIAEDDVTAALSEIPPQSEIVLEGGNNTRVNINFSREHSKVTEDVITDAASFGEVLVHAADIGTSPANSVFNNPSVTTEVEQLDPTVHATDHMFLTGYLDTSFERNFYVDMDASGVVPSAEVGIYDGQRIALKKVAEKHGDACVELVMDASGVVPSAEVDFGDARVEVVTEVREKDGIFLDMKEDAAVETGLGVDGVERNLEAEIYNTNTMGEQPRMGFSHRALEGTPEDRFMNTCEHPNGSEAYQPNLSEGGTSGFDIHCPDSMDYAAGAGNNTDFLNVDDDDLTAIDDDHIPDDDETQYTDNSGWSSRTRAVSKYLQMTFAKEAERGRMSLSMDNLLIGKSRKEASRMFFETLVLKTRDYIRVEQPNPYDDITIKPRTRLVKADF